MDEYIARGRTLPEAYHASLIMLAENAKETPCPENSTAGWMMISAAGFRGNGKIISSGWISC